MNVEHIEEIKMLTKKSIVLSDVKHSFMKYWSMLIKVKLVDKKQCLNLLILSLSGQKFDKYRKLQFET